MIYVFWLPVWYLLVIMLFVLWFTDSDYLFGICWSLCCLSFRFTYSDYLFGIFWSLCCLSFNLQLLITSLVSFGHYVVCPLIVASDYLFGIFWSLCCLSFDLQILITSLVSFGHYIVCPLIYVFWLPVWYLLVIMLFVLWFTYSGYPFGYLLVIMLFVLWFKYSDYPFGFFWSLCCLSFNLRILITSLVSFGHYVVCPLIYVFWLPLWYLFH